MSNYARGNAEQIAADARRYVRNELQGKIVTRAHAEQLAKYLARISMDRRVPRDVRRALKQSVWDEFKIDRFAAVLVSTVEAGDRQKRLRLGFRGAIFS